MGQRVWHEDRLLAALAAGATVVTGNERLARAIQLAHADAQTRAGQAVWERPRVLPWQAFLAEQAAACRDAALESGGAGPPYMLSPSQSECLWEQMIQMAGDTLLQPAAAAEAAQQAWNLCQAYRVDIRQFADSGSSDAQQFAAWSAAFHKRCDAQRCLDAARLPERLADWMAAGRIAPPSQLLLAGFDEWTPQQQHFAERLQAAGCRIERLDPAPAATQNARRVVCDDAEQEFWYAARWAGALLEQNPGTRIGIVVHDLAACRTRLARILDQALCPSASFGGSPVRPYTLSLGRPLADWPVTHDALLLLGIAQAGLEFRDVSRMLRSPFMRGADAERDARARLELRLREGAVRIPLVRLIGQARGYGKAPALVTALEAAQTWTRAQARRQLPSVWARGFAGLLHELGWPGERTPDSDEYQCVEKFRELFGELARLDTVLGAVSQGYALRVLSRLAMQQVFQPRSGDVPVQVMGMLESAGLHFDHLWITGLTDDVWPASPRPDALIPVALQRHLDLPHASAHRELEFARQLTGRLLASAADVVVSTARRNADEALRPSPLIGMLPQCEPAQLPQREVSACVSLLHAARPAQEFLEDAQGAPLPTGTVRGGTGILKAQAACPFQAFARHRLGAQPLPEPATGPDALARGKLLHDVLHRVWAELGDQTALANRDAAALEELVTHHVDAALAVAQSRAPGLFAPALLQLEGARLKRLVGDWLQLERARVPFSVVKVEAEQTAHIGPLSFEIRADRMDRLADGSCVIIDYKTSDAKPAAWSGERPDEPQLPCYAVTAEADVAAVLFGILRPGMLEFRGHAREAGVAPGVAAFDSLKRRPDECADWDALLGHWRTSLEQLAQQFAAGEAQVDPKHGDETCKFCHLAAVCRIDESGRAAAGEDDE
ncbi:MAG TPA: PD-(D/E)XK nuclease family protein [Gammaproteobacteria bacterium]|nr:PD-(D/E)XK nuclease family protein [Gammaproteobacteria bacterium]